MSDSDKGNPFEELQKELQKALGGKKVVFGGPGFAPGAASSGGTGEDEEENKRRREEKLARVREFRLRPREVVAHLDRYIIGQEEAKKVLAVAVCDHYNHIRWEMENGPDESLEYQKQNVLLLGPTGVGKTYLMRTLSRLIGVPFVKADATKFSETGYVGADVDDLVRDLVKNAEGDTDLAEMGIIYIDEIDKIARSETGGAGKDVSGRGVQINLLKLMEETEVPPFSQTDMMAQMQAMMGGGRGGAAKRPINTRKILFIVSGAFDTLAERIQRRLNQSRMGFGAETPDDERIYRYLHHAETGDFIHYGFEPEFIGRLPVRVAFDPLSAADLSRILRTSEGSILRQYVRDFAAHGIDLRVADEAIEAVAEIAAGENTGARGIMSVMERVFRGFKFELPSTSVRQLEVDAATIRDPDETLRRILREEAERMRARDESPLGEFVRKVEEEHGVALSFTPEARDYLEAEAAAASRPLPAFCEEHFRDLPFGLRIVSRREGRREFVIDLPCARNPDQEISRWIMESFRAAGDPSDSKKES